MNASTRTYPLGFRRPKTEDVVLQLREWGTSRNVYPFPDGARTLTIGSSRSSDLQIGQPGGYVSRRHARLMLEGETWVVHDEGSKNGISDDDAPSFVFPLSPGSEVGIGGVRLIAESARVVGLRYFLARILGLTPNCQPEIDRALRSLRDTERRQKPLVLCGGKSESDLVAIARQLNRARGEGRPFVVLDGRLLADGVAAASRDITRELRGAAGGAVCVWAHRLPADTSQLRNQLATSGAELWICARLRDVSPFGTEPIIIPDLASRRDELAALVDLYAGDAIERLRARYTSYTNDDRDWIVARSSRTLAEIEAGTLRRIALREWGSVTKAAAQLGITQASFSRWMRRRKPRR